MDRAQVQEASLISFQSVNNLTTVNLLTLCKRANSWESISVQDTLSLLCLTVAPIRLLFSTRVPRLRNGLQHASSGGQNGGSRSSLSFSLTSRESEEVDRRLCKSNLISLGLRIRVSLSTKYFQMVFSIGLLNTRYSIFGRF